LLLSAGVSPRSRGWRWRGRPVPTRPKPSHPHDTADTPNRFLIDFWPLVSHDNVHYLLIDKPVSINEMSKKRADNNQPVLIDESLIGEAEERFNGAGPNVTSNAPIRPEWTVNQRELRSRCGRYTHSHTPAPTHTATHPAIHPLRYPPAPSHTRPHTGFDTHPLPHTPGHTPASIPTRWYTHRRHHTTARVCGSVCGSVCVSDGRNVLSHRFVDPPDRLFTFSINRREEELNNCRFISELAVALQFPHPSYSVLLLPHPTGECWKSF